ncbi:ankyrin repeat-containing domain protein [Aspergillus heterothallicus]
MAVRAAQEASGEGEEQKEKEDLEDGRNAHIPDVKAGKYGSASRWASARGVESTLLQALDTGENPTVELLGLAAKYGHARIIRVLHEQELNVNAELVGKDEFAPMQRRGEFTKRFQSLIGTPLSLAAEHGREEVVRVLLAHAVSMDCSTGTEHKRSPLALAAYSDHAAVVAMLLDAGAEIDGVDSENRTPLQLAAYNGHSDVISPLLSRGADPNRQDTKGADPLKSAATRGHLNVVRCLFEYGADCSFETLYGPVGQYKTEIFELLLQRIDLMEAAQRSQENLRIASCVAAAYGRLEVLTRLISNGLDVNAAPIFHFDKFGHSYAPPLSWAADHERLDSVRLLLANNAIQIGSIGLMAKAMMKTSSRNSPSYPPYRGAARK